VSDTVAPERVRIWSNGTEHMAWEEYNCDRCAKMHLGEDGHDTWECDLVDADLHAQFGDGTFDVEIARRLGYPQAAVRGDGVRLWVWRCPEFQLRPVGR